jgi:UrcA family protein
MFTTFNSTVTRAVLGTVGTAFCAGICLAAATAPANAGTVYDTARSQTVRYADLNLDSREGRKTLDRRISRAAHAVCATGSVDVATMKDESRCVRAALDSAKPKIVAAVMVRPITG